MCGEFDYTSVGTFELVNLIITTPTEPTRPPFDSLYRDFDTRDLTAHEQLMI